MALTHEFAGSNPAPATVVWKFPQGRNIALHEEVIRLDEEPVLKTGGEHGSLVGSSPTASAEHVRVF